MYNLSATNKLQDGGTHFTTLRETTARFGAHAAAGAGWRSANGEGAKDSAGAASACPPRIIIVFNFLFITLTCNAETWNGVIKSSSQIYCCHGRVALSKAYDHYQLRAHRGVVSQSKTHKGMPLEPPSIFPIHARR